MMTIRRGHTGKEVLIWQGILGIGESGDFDENTESATMQWQAQRGLEPDGVVGPKTWALAGVVPVIATKPECEEAFWPMTEECEGKVYSLYLDVLGLVTTAIGNLCDNVHVATAMPFKRADGSPASPDEIRAEHAFVKSQFCGMKGAENRAEGKVCPWRALGKVCFAHHGWRASHAATKLRLTDDGVKSIVMSKMREHDIDLVRQYPEFGSWPWQAQLATHSMAWACGSRFGGSHPGGFPSLAGHLRAGDFAAAAASCHMNEKGNPGLVKRNAKNKALYLEAHRLLQNDVPTSPSIPNPASEPTIHIDKVPFRHFTDDDPRHVAADDDE